MSGGWKFEVGEVVYFRGTAESVTVIARKTDYSLGRGIDGVVIRVNHWPTAEWRAERVFLNYDDNLEHVKRLADKAARSALMATQESNRLQSVLIELAR